MMWEEVSPRAREIAEKIGLQSFKKLRWDDRKHLEELTGKLIPRLRSQLYDAMRDREVPAPAFEQDRRAGSPASGPRGPRLVEVDGSRTPKRRTFF